MLHQVLQIPELLSLIFSHTDERSNAACSIVCKKWLDPALNELWRCVNDPIILLSLLAPMHTIVMTDDTPRWLFSRFVLPSDWPRFQFYAQRIRSLDYREVGKQEWIDASVYAEVARTRPTVVILPKLRRFVWHTKLLNQAIIFMHQNITQLVTHIDEPFLAAEGFLEARAFLMEAAARLPNLVLLDIRASFSVVHVQTALLHLLESIRLLKKVILPRYWLTSSVISALANSPCLEVAQWEYVGQGEGDRKDVEDFQVSTVDGAFPALNDLSLEVNLCNATELIDSSFFPAHLNTFYLQCLQFTPPSDIHHFLRSCSINCQALTYLHLDLHDNAPRDAQGSSQITLETLEPALSCPNLVRFMLTYNQPLSITDSDAEVLAKRWPSLVALHLNHEPVALTPPDLTFAALLPFAEHCTNLEELGLYINATAPIPSLSNSRLFTRLRHFHFGTSPIDVVNSVALFLSRICSPSYADSPSIEISVGVSWDPALRKALGTEVWEEVEKRKSVWQSVRTYLPMLLSLRWEERTRSQLLEEELEELRARNHALEVRPPNSMSAMRQRFAKSTY